MIRFSNFLVFSLILFVSLAVWSVLSVKARIAVDRDTLSQTRSALQKAEQDRSLLEAEWAVLQRRDSLLALAQAPFGAGLGGIPGEIEAAALPQRATTTGGHERARAMFLTAANALAHQTNTDALDENEAIDPSARPYGTRDFIAEVIADFEAAGTGTPNP